MRIAGKMLRGRRAAPLFCKLGSGQKSVTLKTPKAGVGLDVMKLVRVIQAKSINNATANWRKLMMKWLKIISLFGVIAVAIYLVLTADEPLDAYQKQPMPPLILNGLNGEEVSTANWALETNGPKVINLFASWCTPCIKEIPELMELAKHVPVYGIAWRDDPEDLKQWLEKHGNPYKEVGIDKGLTFIWDLGVSSVPTTLLLDSSQRIVYIQQGMISKADIENQILPRLEQLK